MYIFMVRIQVKPKHSIAIFLLLISVLNNQVQFVGTFQYQRTEVMRQIFFRSDKICFGLDSKKDHLYIIERVNSTFKQKQVIRLNEPVESMMVKGDEEQLFIYSQKSAIWFRKENGTFIKWYERRFKGEQKIRSADLTADFKTLVLGLKNKILILTFNGSKYLIAKEIPLMDTRLLKVQLMDNQEYLSIRTDKQIIFYKVKEQYRREHTFMTRQREEVVFQKNGGQLKVFFMHKSQLKIYNYEQNMTQKSTIQVLKKGTFAFKKNNSNVFIVTSLQYIFYYEIEQRKQNCFGQSNFRQKLVEFKDSLVYQINEDISIFRIIDTNETFVNKSFEVPEEEEDKNENMDIPQKNQENKLNGTSIDRLDKTNFLFVFTLTLVFFGLLLGWMLHIYLVIASTVPSQAHPKQSESQQKFHMPNIQE